MTIRESVWFTDDTYQYEDVVRLIPNVRHMLLLFVTLQILFSCRGRIQRVKMLDFLDLFERALKVRLFFCCPS